jgi:hypothetical protein
MKVQLTNFGFRYAAVRKPIVNAETHDYVRVTLFVSPFTVIIPPNDQYKLAQMLVPIDDVNTMFYWIAWHETQGIDQEAWRKFCGAQVGIDIDENYRKVRTLENRFLQDRQGMRLGDFTGIKGIPSQDMAMWESMGPISDRTEDNLGLSDIAVVQFRRQMIAAAKRMRQEGAAIGTDEPRVSRQGLSPRELFGQYLATRDIEDPRLGRLFEQLDGRGALPRHDARVVVWWHEVRAGAPHHFFQPGLARSVAGHRTDRNDPGMRREAVSNRRDQIPHRRGGGEGHVVGVPRGLDRRRVRLLGDGLVQSDDVHLGAPLTKRVG